MSLLNKKEITKRHFKQAQALMQSGKLWEAKQLLGKVDHPKSQEWIDKIKKRERYLRMRVIKRVAGLIGVAILTVGLWIFVHNQWKGSLYHEGDILDAKSIAGLFCDIYLEHPESACDRWVNALFVNSSNNHGNAEAVLKCNDRYSWAVEPVSFYDCILLTYDLPVPS